MKTIQDKTKLKSTYVAIMAGGIGSRFWPVSREAYPKQFLDILNTGKTLLQSTFERYSEFIPEENIYIITSEDYVHLVKKQLPQCQQENIIGETRRRNTAPCVALIAHKLQKLDPESMLIVAPSDHQIEKGAAFVNDTFLALQKAETGAFVTFGIKPTYPNTGFGYICYTPGKNDQSTYKVEHFTEKPDAQKANYFFKSGNYLWNSGIFVWSTKDLLKAFEKHARPMHTIFEKYRVMLNTKDEKWAIKEIYDRCESISIDYAILEKSNNVYVVPAKFNWSDLGTWNSAWQNSKKDGSSNAITSKEVHAMDAQNCMVYSTEKKLILIGGVEDIVVVNTADALLVVNRSNEQQLTAYLSDLKDTASASYF